MTDIPITHGFDQDMNHMKGYATLSPEAKEQIEDFLAKGHTVNFEVGFIGEPNEDGTYDKVELIELSMIVK